MIGILAFEGPDKVGKSTTIHRLNRETNYQYLCIDRFLASAWVYDTLTGRRNRDEELTAAEQELGRTACSRVVNVLLTCDRDVLADRIREQEEEPELRLKNLDRMVELYEQYTKITMLPYIQVDTTHISVEDTVQAVLGRLHEYDV